MMKNKNKHVGSSFDDFLEEEGILAETEAIAIKRVIAFQLEQEMATKNLSKTALARRMNTSRAALNRLLDPENPSVTLLTLENAARALDKTLAVQMV